MTPLLFAILFALVCAAMFLLGLRAFRMAEPPGGATVAQVRRFGRLMMMASTAMLIFLVAIVIHGDLKLGLSR
jgi:cytochrome bd-type quinol oxidase subunit 1